MDSGAQSSEEQPDALESPLPVEGEARKPVLEVSDKIAISVGIIAGIILFLEQRENPVAVISLLLIMYCCGLYVLWHLVRLLPWSPRVKAKTTWQFVVSMVVVGIVWAAVVGFYGVKRWPKRQIIVVVSFKDSPLFTPTRRRKIEIDLDDYYLYLTGLGFDLPKEIPPLGLSPPHGPMLGGGSQGPAYYSSLIIPEDMIDDANMVRHAYSAYTFNRILVWPDAFRTSISRAEAEDDEVAAWIYSCYYGASFGGKIVCGKDAPGHKWTDAIWGIRGKYGQEYTDLLMCYTLKMWRDLPPKYVEKFDKFFRYKLVAGESVKDNSPERYRELNEVLKQHGVDVTQP